jgi:uncharacterized protein
VPGAQRTGAYPTIPLVLSYYALLIVAWIGAWLIHERLGVAGQTPLVDTLYWTMAKLLVWLLPACATLRIYFQVPVAAYLSLHGLRRGTQIGLTLGVAFALISLVRDAFTRSFGLPVPDPGLVNALVIAPLLEELLFRGFLLAALQETGLPFWQANVVTALMFLGLHLPGWYVMGSPNISDAAAMLGIVVVGLVAGLAKRLSGSTWGSTLFHAVNNLYSAFLR